MLMFLKPYRLPEKLIYSIDLSELDKHIKWEMRDVGD
jgi:hypothetical protein